MSFSKAAHILSYKTLHKSCMRLGLNQIFIGYSMHVSDGIVALGKFDALHIGHRELAMYASKAGTPFLLSFVGIAEVLGWEYR